ncbi:MAG: VOC family protein [Acidimicrobiales bacterium]
MSEPTIIPYLAVHDARAAMEFYATVFGATVVDGELFEMDDGRIGHVTLAIGAARIYVSDEYPEMNVTGPIARGGTTVAIVIHVADADETYGDALAAGATAERPVENQHGARSGWFVDPWGHRWSPTSTAKPQE